jgi:hypothetical protein
VKEKIVISLFCIAITIEECWTWVSWPAKIISPFPYAPEQQIRWDSMIWILCQHTQWMIGISCFWWLSDKMKLFFAVAFFIQLAEVIEFFFNYNNPWCTLFPGAHHLHINVTNLRFFILIPLAFYKVLTWKI